MLAGTEGISNASEYEIDLIEPIIEGDKLVLKIPYHSFEAHSNYRNYIKLIFDGPTTIELISFLHKAKDDLRTELQK